LAPTGEDRSVVAIGDDVTDEDMFHEIRGHGLAVIVGNPARASEAVYRIDSPQEVATFLRALADFGGEAS
jgi:trehalose-phosphatase